MGDRVEGVRSDVEHQAVAALLAGDPLGVGHRPGRDEQGSHVRRVLGGHRSGVHDVSSGNDKDVNRGLRIDVTESDGPVVCADHVGGNLSGHDAAEQAVGQVVTPSRW
jgi:hypothetical protein